MQIALSGQANVLELPLLNKSTGDPIVSGTVNFYVVDKDGDNANKWYKGSDGLWYATEQIAGVATHRADGSWYASLPSAVWQSGKRYDFYGKETNDYHVTVGRDILVSSVTRQPIAIINQANVLTLPMIAKANLAPITTGTVNFYLVAKDGTNAGKYYNANGTWTVAEAVAGVATHRADGHWYLSFPSACWSKGVRYRFYAKESNDYHVIVGMDILADIFMRVVVGTDKLESSPAKIMAYYIINNLAEMSEVNSGDAWPLYPTFLPDGSNVAVECGSVLDTAPDIDSRLMIGSYVQRFGIQLRIRGRDYEVARAKIESIASSLDEVWNEQLVIGSDTFHIQNVSRSSSIVPLGWEPESTRRVNFVINLLVGLKKL